MVCRSVSKDAKNKRKHSPRTCNTVNSRIFVFVLNTRGCRHCKVRLALDMVWHHTIDDERQIGELRTTPEITFNTDPWFRYHGSEVLCITDPWFRSSRICGSGHHGWLPSLVVVVERGGGRRRGAAPIPCGACSLLWWLPLPPLGVVALVVALA